MKINAPSVTLTVYCTTVTEQCTLYNVHIPYFVKKNYYLWIILQQKQLLNLFQLNLISLLMFYDGSGTISTKAGGEGSYTQNSMFKLV